MGQYSHAKIYKVISSTNFNTDGVSYLFGKIDKKYFSDLMKQIANHNDVYIEVINDKDELTIIMPLDLWDSEFGESFALIDRLEDLALITCQVKEETVTGYLLALATILSTHNISIFVQGAFTTDHIFVEQKNLDEALELLNQLKTS